MIISLSIENFAIIDRIDINFEKGLNMVTGETGTGKSIVVEAINLLLGERADKTFIRHGKEKSKIDAMFHIEQDKHTDRMLDQFGIDREEDGMLLISREIYSSGRSVARVNGRIVTVGMLKEIVSKLINIQGQNQNQGLVLPQRQLDLLDKLGGDETQNLRRKISDEYDQYKSLTQRIDSLKSNEMEKQRKMDLLKFQIQEIEEAELKKDEEGQLMEDYNRLSSSEDIKIALEKSKFELSGSEFGEGKILEKVHALHTSFKKVEELDDRLKNFSDEFLSTYYQLQELNRDIIEYDSNMDYSTESFDAVTNRIDQINDLKRKYGSTVSDVLDYKVKIEAELTTLENLEQELDILESEKKAIYDVLIENSEKIAKIRRRAADILEDKLSLELKELNMKDSEFRIDISKRDEISKLGLDNVSFMISTNLGQPFKPLAKVASGGEISRIMLAFKNIIAEQDEIATLVFDEIDAGISGRTAQLVGEKIYSVSKTHQIICITHLPQISVMGDAHYRISKSVDEGITTASIDKLSYDEKIDEISRLIGGVSLTDKTREHAKEMIELSERFK